MADRFSDERLKQLEGVLCEECGGHKSHGTGRALKNPLLGRWFVEYHCPICNEDFFTWRAESDARVRTIAEEYFPR